MQTIGDLSAAQAATPAAAKSGCVYFEITRHNACGGFAAYWSRFGRLAVYGYPLTGELQQNGMTVQYFQRARFEWHPGVAPRRYDVLLGLAGDEWSTTAGLRASTAFQLVGDAPSGDCAYFSATKHSACGSFAAYLTRFGGLPVFGYPISEPDIDQNGTEVQYFERARMELRPGSWPERYDIQLGLLGDQLLTTMR